MESLQSDASTVDETHSLINRARHGELNELDQAFGLRNPATGSIANVAQTLGMSRHAVREAFLRLDGVSKLKKKPVGRPLKDKEWTPEMMRWVCSKATLKS